MSEKEPMRAEQKSNVKNSIGRLGVTGISIIIQVLWIIFLFIRLNRYSTAISLFSSILALIVRVPLLFKRSLYFEFKKIPKVSSVCKIWLSRENRM